MSEQLHNNTQKEGPPDGAFVPLYLANERLIYSYILAMVPNWTDADDLLQETSEIMWSKFSEFELGTDFVRWALCIAKFRVLNYYKTRKNRPLQFDENILEILDYRMFSVSEQKQQDGVHQALMRCIGKLDESDRRLLDLRYEYNATTKSVASRLGRSMDSVYKALRRIHNQLFYCVRNSLGKESPA